MIAKRITNQTAAAAPMTNPMPAPDSAPLSCSNRYAPKPAAVSSPGKNSRSVLIVPKIRFRAGLMHKRWWTKEASAKAAKGVHPTGFSGRCFVKKPITARLVQKRASRTAQILRTEPFLPSLGYQIGHKL